MQKGGSSEDGHSSVRSFVLYPQTAQKPNSPKRILHTRSISPDSIFLLPGDSWRRRSIRCSFTLRPWSPLPLLCDPSTVSLLGSACFRFVVSCEAMRDGGVRDAVDDSSIRARRFATIAVSLCPFLHICELSVLEEDRTELRRWGR